RLKQKSFFFSSRRRHTIWPRDWSSDVCSSDLCSSLVKRIGPDALVDPTRTPTEGPLAARRYLSRSANSICCSASVFCASRHRREIGRASCRERVEISVDEESVEKKK